MKVISYEGSGSYLVNNRLKKIPHFVLLSLTSFPILDVITVKNIILWFLFPDWLAQLQNKVKKRHPHGCFCFDVVWRPRENLKLAKQLPASGLGLRFAFHRQCEIKCRSLFLCSLRPYFALMSLYKLLAELKTETD